MVLYRVSEASDQTALVHSLICAIAVRICLKNMERPIYDELPYWSVSASIQSAHRHRFSSQDPTIPWLAVGNIPAMRDKRTDLGDPTKDNNKDLFASHDSDDDRLVILLCGCKDTIGR